MSFTSDTVEQHVANVEAVVQRIQQWRSPGAAGGSAGAATTAAGGAGAGAGTGASRKFTPY